MTVGGDGDAEHVSDFDNDGKQEIFMAHEAGKHNDDTIPYAVDIKRYNGDIMLQAATRRYRAEVLWIMSMMNMHCQKR